MSGSPTAVVMARAARRGEVRRALEPLLGAARCQTLHAELTHMALQWARAATHDHVVLAYEPADAGAEFTELAGGAELMPQHGDGIAARVSHVAGRLLTERGGPLLIVWPDLIGWRAELATAALADLKDGVEVVVGPCTDGGLYLLGLSRVVPELFAVPDAEWRRGQLISTVVSALAPGGRELGMLRAERALRRPGDVRAALADPLLPPRLRGILEAG